MRTVFLAFIRIWLPAIVTLVGVIVIIAGGGDEISLEGGAGIIGAGLAIWLMNALFRVGLGNDRDRDEEDAARDFFDAHGYWPDEPAPPAPAPRTPPPVAERSDAMRRPAPAPSASRLRSGSDRGPMRPRRPG